MVSKHESIVVASHRLQKVGSVGVVHGLSCRLACGIVPGQGLNLWPLHWQADYSPVDPQGSPDE